LVIKTSLYYDARSEKHQIIFLYILFFIFETANGKSKRILKKRRKCEKIKRKERRCKDRRVLSVYLLAVCYEAVVNYRRNTFLGAVI
jgi:hypothetical protein